MRVGQVVLFLRGVIGAFHRNKAASRAVVRGLRGIAGVFGEDELARLPLSDLAVFAVGQGVTSPFLDALRQAGALDRLPPAERQALVSDAAKTALWNQGYLDELSGVAEAFRREAIEYVIVRGPVLVHRAYGDALKRRFTDLDVLVRPEQIRAAVGALQGLGYERTQRTERDIERRGWKGVVELVRETQARSFDVDLHTTLLNRRRLQPVFALDKPDVWARRTQETLPGIGAAPALSLEDSLLHAVAHLVLQHQMSDVRLFLDCAMLIRRRGTDLDWGLLFARARQAGCEALLSCVLSLIGKVIPLPKDEHLSKAVARGNYHRSCYPLSKLFSIQNCVPNLRETTSCAWQWVLDRQGLFHMVDCLHTAIRLALTESVPSAWRVRRLRSRKLSRLGRTLWSIPMAAVLPWYIPVLLAHGVLVRFVEPLIPAPRADGERRPRRDTAPC